MFFSFGSALGGVFVGFAAGQARRAWLLASLFEAAPAITRSRIRRGLEG
jgi:hypothetical protein